MFCAGSKLTNNRKGEQKYTTKKLSSFITVCSINYAPSRSTIPTKLDLFTFRLPPNLKFEDSSLTEPDLFAFGPIVNLPASNEPY